MSSFLAAIGYVLENEGGLVDDPNDSGGLTNFGIALNKNPGMTAAQIRNMTRQEAGQWYFENFWSNSNLPNIQDQRVATKAFDCMVNMGVSGGTKVLQRACCQEGLLLTTDGAFGPATLRAVNSIYPPDLLTAMVSQSISHYREIEIAHPQDKKFDKDWMKRATKLPC